MGLSLHATRFLLECWQSGVSFGQVMTLGRQHVMVGPERLERLFRDSGAWPPKQGEETFRSQLTQSHWRFEALARGLGAAEVEACDASPYEGANVVWDLNQPIPDDWGERYDLVIDGGTLEHVFNFPVAIANCMRWVKVGGHVILITPANNFMGHGFYQFSPELFYRVFSPANGFEVQRMIATVDTGGTSRLLGTTYSFEDFGRWYEVPDPSTVRSRITLINDKSVLLYVLARKTERRPPLANPPQQSDYLEQWQAGESEPLISLAASRNPLVRWALRTFGESFCRETLPRLAGLVDPFRWRRHRRQHSFANRRFYRPVFPVTGSRK
jgi:hypothetical protein